MQLGSHHRMVLRSSSCVRATLPLNQGPLCADMGIRWHKCMQRDYTLSCVLFCIFHLYCAHQKRGSPYLYGLRIWYSAASNYTHPSVQQIEERGRQTCTMKQPHCAFPVHTHTHRDIYIYIYMYTQPLSEHVWTNTATYRHLGRASCTPCISLHMLRGVAGVVMWLVLQHVSL